MRGLSVLVGAAALTLSSLVIPGHAVAATETAKCQYAGRPGMQINAVGGAGPRSDGQPVRLAVTDSSLISATSCQIVVTATASDVYGQACGSASITTTVNGSNGSFPDVTLPAVNTCGAGRVQYFVNITQPGNPNFGPSVVGPDITIVHPDASTQNPIGQFYAASSAHVGMFLLESGWAVDRSTADANNKTAPINVKLYVDGAYKTTVLANKQIQAYEPDSIDENHGFTASIYLGPNSGTHTVCATAVNVGAGADTSLGCHTVTLSANPIGHLDQAVSSDGGKSVVARGWDLDPNTQGSIYTDIYVDGVQKARVKATISRPDVDKAYHMGAAHGFAATVSGLAAGHHSVCAYALNVYGGTSNPKIGCINV